MAWAVFGPSMYAYCTRGWQTMPRHRCTHLVDRARQKFSGLLPKAHFLSNIGLLSDDLPKPGEWVLIHVGFALSKIDEAEAAAALQFLEGIGQAYADELEALQASQIE